MNYQPPATGDRLLSIADIARHFSLPESTARYYCKRFAAYMPVSGEGRRKRYRKEVLEIVRTVLDAMRDARSANGVEALLAERFPCNALSVLPGEMRGELPASTPAVAVPVLSVRYLEQQSRALEGIASALTMLVRRGEKMEELVSLARTAYEDKQEMRAELSRLRLLLDSSEKVHQQDMDQIRGWLSRIVREHTAAAV